MSIVLLCLLAPAVAVRQGLLDFRSRYVLARNSLHTAESELRECAALSNKNGLQQVRKTRSKFILLAWLWALLPSSL